METQQIPRWIGLLLLVAVIYLGLVLPSEFKPLPVVRTIPPAGDRDVALDTVLQVHFGPGGLEGTFGEEAPSADLYYDGEEKKSIPASVVSHGEVLQITPRGPLQPGRRVLVAVHTRYGRDLIWSFYTSVDKEAPAATPLPTPRRPSMKQ